MVSRVLEHKGLSRAPQLAETGVKERGREKKRERHTRHREKRERKIERKRGWGERECVARQ